MNVVDSSGWLEYFTDGANADFFATPIGDTDHLLVPAICLYEVFKRVLMVLNEERALDAVGMMSLGLVVDINRQVAIEAARIAVEHKLAMADSMILVIAQRFTAELWTQDSHFQGFEGVHYIQKSE